MFASYTGFNYTDFPLVTYRPGEVVLGAGSKTGQLLFLKEGAVEIVRQNTQIAVLEEPGAVLGEISALLDRPHTTEVRALKRSQFHVANAALLGQSASALFYVAEALAQRLDRTNQALVASLRPR